MELDELQGRLTRFVRVHLDDPRAEVSGVVPGPGHAGFSYFFDVNSDGLLTSYFLRMPPPGTKHEGTADVLRQVAAIKALKDTSVPHAPILWSGDDEQWFGDPYFIQPRLDGDTLKDGYPLLFNDEQKHWMAKQAMAALAEIHKVDGKAKAPYLGDFWGYEFDITRWDRFYERAADQELLALQPRIRQLLLDKAPHDARIGLAHGDFQWTNLLYSREAKLLAVIDWELCGIGPTLNDLGWICVFSDPSAWAHEQTAGMPHGDQLEAWYREFYGADAGDVRWFKALAVYKFAIITGLNLMLHRRGKRHDPHWEDIRPSMQSNMEYALRMLTG